MAPSCVDKFWKWSKITYCDIPTGSSPAHQLQVNWASLRLCRFWWIWVKHPSKWRQLSVLYVPRRQIGSIWLHWSMTSGRWWLCHSLLARSGWGVLMFGDIMWSLTPENPNAWKKNSSFVGKHTHTHTQQLFEVRSPGCLGNFGVTDFVNDDNENCTSCSENGDNSSNSSSSSRSSSR